MIGEPLSWYTDQNSLRFHLLNVGEGLMTLIIFPNNVVMLFDCNVTNDNEDEVLKFLDTHIPEQYNSEKQQLEKSINIFANSHRDEDHYRGLRKINEKFPIKSIWDSGQTGATTSSHDYQYYMYLRLHLKEKDPNNLFVPIPSNIPITNFGSANIYCLAAEEDFVKDYVNKGLFESAIKIQHTNSMVLLIEFGGRKLLMTGDSDWKSWRDKIVPNFNQEDFLKSNILIASHHGSRSFFTDELNDSIDVEANPDTTYIESIELITPDVTLISCGDYDSAHHPNNDALKLYKSYTIEAQVYTTYSKGSLLGCIDEYGNFTVVPDRFKNSINAPHTVGFGINCVKRKNGFEEKVANNAYIEIGCTLKFTINSYGGLIEPFDKVNIIWEVSNGGLGEHYFHQEIYYNDDQESDGILIFSRELCYKGTHLLRCSVMNKKKSYYITKVFVVNGI